MKNKLLWTHRKRSHDFNHKSLILRVLYIRHFVLASTGLHLFTSYLLPFHLLHLFTSCHIHVTKSNQTLNFTTKCQPGVVAHASNPATWRLGCLNGLRSGFLGAVVLCRSGVHAKFGVNMGNMEESALSRLVKEERIGPGWKHSRQKLPRQTVVGSHLWIGDRSHRAVRSR